MSRFVSNELQTIDLGEGEWVKIPVALSYRTVLSMTGQNANEAETAKTMLVACIKEWNFKDKEGNNVEVNEDNILSLDLQTIKQITEAITPLFQNNQDKKK